MRERRVKVRQRRVKVRQNRVNVRQVRCVCRGETGLELVRAPVDRTLFFGFGFGFFCCPVS